MFRTKNIPQIIVENNFHALNRDANGNLAISHWKIKLQGTVLISRDSSIDSTNNSY